MQRGRPEKDRGKPVQGRDGQGVGGIGKEGEDAGGRGGLTGPFMENGCPGHLKREEPGLIRI